MVTRVVQYTDLDGNAVEKTLMFNINKMDKIRFGNKHPRMEEEVKAISDAAQKAETEEEKKIIHERLMAKYLVAGFVTVTTFSVIVAGIFVKFI